jgi:hypothetical protein
MQVNLEDILIKKKERKKERKKRHGLHSRTEAWDELQAFRLVL